MDKQEEKIIIRIDKNLKDRFKSKSDDEYQTISARIKYLIKKDVEGKLIIDNA